MGVIKDAAGDFSLLRIAIPGAVAAVAVHPLITSWLDPLTRGHFSADTLLVLSLETLVIGLVLNLAARPIIMLYEGFRLPFLTAWLYRFQKARVTRLHRRLFRLTQEEEAGVFHGQEANAVADSLRDYPVFVDDAGACGWHAERPTLLGNIIAAYELYPQTRYGFSGITFWHHLLYLAPEAARKDFATKVALAEGLCLGSAAGGLVLSVCLAVTFCLGLGALFPQGRIGVAPLSFRELLLVALFGASALCLLYRLALPAYRDTSSSFRALTDLTVPSLRAWMIGAPRHPPGQNECQEAADVEAFTYFMLCRDDVDPPGSEPPK